MQSHRSLGPINLYAWKKQRGRISDGPLKFSSLFLQDVSDGRGDRAHLRLHHPLRLRARLPLRVGLSVRVSEREREKEEYTQFIRDKNQTSLFS